MVLQVIELGAAITSILVPDKHGEFDDVTPGFDTLAGEFIGQLCHWLSVFIVWYDMSSRQLS